MGSVGSIQAIDQELNDLVHTATVEADRKMQKKLHHSEVLVALTWWSESGLYAFKRSAALQFVSTDGPTLLHARKRTQMNDTLHIHLLTQASTLFS